MRKIRDIKNPHPMFKLTFATLDGDYFVLTIKSIISNVDYKSEFFIIEGRIYFRISLAVWILFNVSSLPRTSMI